MTKLLTSTSASKLLGVSPSTILRVARRLKIGPKSFSAHQRKKYFWSLEMLEQIKKGLS